MKKIICGMMSCLIILSMLFMGNVNVKAASTPELNKSNITLVKGKTGIIKIQDATVSEKNAAEWESSNTNVVTVTQTGQTGRLKAKEIGEAKVIVSVAVFRQGTSLLFHLVCGLPCSRNDLSHSAHCL